MGEWDDSGGMLWLFDGQRDLTPPAVSYFVLTVVTVVWSWGVWCMQLTMLHVEGDME